MSEERRNRLLYGAGILATAVFCLVPVVYMVLTAASGRPDFLAPGVEFSPTLAHFRELLGTESLRFPAYLRNSLIVSGASSLLCIAVAAPAAYAITRFPLPGRMTILFLVLAVSMFPQISLVSYLFRVMGDLGWINTLPALILPYTAWTLPLSLWILTSYFSRVPKDLDRAARVDGCGQLGVLLRVVLPVAAPGIFSTGILAFLFAFNEFLFALLLTTDHQARTIPVGIALFQGLHGEIPWGTVMAAATLSTVPVVVLTLLFQRRIIQGLTRGAVKG